MKRLNIPQELKKKIKKTWHKRIIAIYDNGGITLDRYSVYFKSKADREKLYNDAVGMSHNPNSPQGFGQWSGGKLGKHNGKSISFDKLPKACQQCIINMFSEDK